MAYVEKFLDEVLSMSVFEPSTPLCASVSSNAARPMENTTGTYYLMREGSQYDHCLGFLLSVWPSVAGCISENQSHLKLLILSISLTYTGWMQYLYKSVKIKRLNTVHKQDVGSAANPHEMH